LRPRSAAAATASGEPSTPVYSEKCAASQALPQPTSSSFVPGAK
jgi:hypothetical protein